MNFEQAFSDYPWLAYGLGLTLGFPLAVVLLSETLQRLETRGRPLAGAVRHLRNLTLPLLALLILLRHMLGLPPSDTAIKLAYTGLSISLLYALLSLVNALLFAEASADSWRAHVPKLFLDLSRAFIVFLGLGLVSGMVWEADLKAFFTALGIGSVVIGLALQDTLGNLFSGIALLFEKPFAIGDVIRVGEQEGVVTEMTWRATWIKATKTHSMLVIPNLSLAKEQVVNLSRLGRHLVRIPLSFSHDDPPNRVKQTLLMTASALPGILKEPPPDAITKGYGEFAVDYEVTFSVRAYPERWALLNEFRSRIWYAARRNGLTLAFPLLEEMRRERMGDEPPQPIAEDAVWEKLAAVATLQTLPTAELRELAGHSVLQHYARNERVIREGEPSATLYLVIEGEALLSTTDRQGFEREVARLGQGEYIGLLQVMLGQPSSLTVQAQTDLLLAAIPTDAAHRLLARSPHLARDLGQSLETRRQAIMQAKEGRTARVH